MKRDTRAVRAKGETYLQKHKNEDAGWKPEVRWLKLAAISQAGAPAPHFAASHSLHFAKEHARSLSTAIEAYPGRRRAAGARAVR